MDPSNLSVYNSTRSAAGRVLFIRHCSHIFLVLAATSLYYFQDFDSSFIHVVKQSECATLR